MRTHRWKRATGSAVVAVMALSGLGATAAAAPAPQLASSTAVSMSPGFTPAQWRAVAAEAAAHSDSAAAAAATQMANRTAGTVQPQAIGMIAKNAIKAALKYGRNLLPSKIRPYADRLYNLIDEIEGTAEISIFTTLVNAGIPPDVARYTAQWIVTFL